MDVGIITIMLGKYTIFFDSFCRSLDQLFLPADNRKFYIFTDGDLSRSLNQSTKSNIDLIGHRKMGWPFDTMMRFHMFNSIQEKLNTHDYLFFLNANMVAVQPVGREILPHSGHDYLVGVNHPGYYNNTNKSEFPYDRNAKCSCHISYSSGKHYFQGCLIGGRQAEFMEMSNVLAQNIDKDLASNIIPLWHDESQLNWYYKDKNPLILDSGYAYPENWQLPFEKKIVQLDKNRFGGHKYLRS